VGGDDKINGLVDRNMLWTSLALGIRLLYMLGRCVKCVGHYFYKRLYSLIRCDGIFGEAPLYINGY